MNNILRSIKKISTGLIFTINRELASNAIYTSYTGIYKNKKCTIFKYKGVYSTIAEESYPLLKYVQDLLYIVPEILAYQKHKNSFYIVTDRMLPIIKKEEMPSNPKIYKEFNEFMSTNISHINNTLLKKHSIILTSLKNITKYNNMNISGEDEGASADLDESSRFINSGEKTTSKSGKEASLVNIDYADIYYDYNNNTKAMVLPIFTTVNNIVYNPNNIIYEMHKVLLAEDYSALYKLLGGSTKILPPHYTRYIINALFSYIEKNKLKTSEVQEIINRCEIAGLVIKPAEAKNTPPSNGNLEQIVSSLILFDASAYYSLLELYTNPTILYIILYLIKKNLYALSLDDINGIFLHINTNISRYINSKIFEGMIIEILFGSLPVLSSTNRRLLIELFIKQDIISKSHMHIKNNLSILMEIENMYSLLIYLLSSKCLVGYRLGVFIMYNNIERISMECILSQIIEIVSKKCLKDELTGESVQLLKYIVDYINNNISEVKKNRGIKIKRQKLLKKKEIEDEWQKRNQMHINKIANNTPAHPKTERNSSAHSDWSNSEW